MKNKKYIKYILLCLLILLACIIFSYYYFLKKPNITVADSGIIYIQKNDTFETIVQILRNKHYLKNEYTFRKIATLKKYPHYIKPGRYRIVDGMNNNQLINRLRSGDQEAVNFTFNNIRTLNDFAKVLSQQLPIDSADFMQLAGDTNIINQYGFDKNNFISMFIPNTYQIFWTISPTDFIKRMHKEYDRFWNSERIAAAQNMGFSPIEIMTIASIVEEETNKVDEYPVIAGVYINRLKKGWCLEACPTLKFALGDFTIKRILDKHLEIDSPYNTYKNTGLPPGPIRMASPKVIDSVLNYTHHNYMFFCAKSDFSGSHHFSRTLREHNKHAAEYHRALNRMKIYR